MTRSSLPSAAFKQRLREMREKRGLSQAQLAERAGLQPAAVSHFETGARKPSFENLVKLAEALSVTTDYLLGRERAAEAAGEEISALFRDLKNATAEDQDWIREILRRRKRGS